MMMTDPRRRLSNCSSFSGSNTHMNDLVQVDEEEEWETDSTAAAEVRPPFLFRRHSISTPSSLLPSHPPPSSSSHHHHLLPSQPHSAYYSYSPLVVATASSTSPSSSSPLHQPLLSHHHHHHHQARFPPNSNHRLRSLADRTASPSPHPHEDAAPNNTDPLASRKRPSLRDSSLNHPTLSGSSDDGHISIGSIESDPVDAHETDEEEGVPGSGEDLGLAGWGALATAVLCSYGWRRKVRLAGLALALLVASLVHQQATRAAQQQYQQAFDHVSQSVLLHVQQSWIQRYMNLESLARSYGEAGTTTTTTNPLADHTNSSVWTTPLTLSDWWGRSSRSLYLAQASALWVMPVVNRSTLAAWESYSVQHVHEWVPASTTNTTSTRPLSASGSSLLDRPPISPFVFNEQGPVTGPGPFLPLWQIAPLDQFDHDVSTWINWDLWSSVPSWQASLQQVLDQRQAVLGPVLKAPEKTQSPMTSTAMSSRRHLALRAGSPRRLGRRATSVTQEEAAKEQSATKLVHEQKSDLLLLEGNSTDEPDNGDPWSPLWIPVFQPASQDTVVAILAARSPWRTLLTRALPSSIHDSLVVVVNYECHPPSTGDDQRFMPDGAAVSSFSFYLQGSRVDSWGPSAPSHLTQYDSSVHAFLALNETILTDWAATVVPFDTDRCFYTMHLYASTAMKNSYLTHQPLEKALWVMALFMAVAVVFIVYDFFVERRQKVILDEALQSSAIVSSLFPEAVRERLFRRNSNDFSQDEHDTLGSRSDQPSVFTILEPAKSRLKTFLTDDGEQNRQSALEAKPLADLFPNCTVLFADISGFTAWSSLRDPGQVFTLLEAVYQAFDRIARKRGVFKVETVGDSYVAVTGLPDPQDDHAAIMARFARDCRNKMNEVCRKLELTLGPDTGDLKMRFGLNSGPVTAGVLRGERSRFQLFGDTVNTAARMESTGERDRIQVSQATADLLREAGKGHWIKARDKPVYAKGKGELQTYWLEFNNKRRSIGSVSSEDSSQKLSCSYEPHNSMHDGTNGISNEKSVIWGVQEEIPEIITQRSKHQRLVDYNVDLLAQHLKRIVARRMMMESASRRASQGWLSPPDTHKHQSTNEEGGSLLSEVTEVIKLPKFDGKCFKHLVDADSIELEPAVLEQLKRYVTVIGAMYRSNPFHNFEHASHVTMSVNKLLQRVVTPDIKLRRSSLRMDGGSITRQIASDLHNYTYGITSDPLTQFAVVFSALIHDVDHWGVSNAQLIKEQQPIAEKYQNKSIAEQNSVDLAWDLLLDADEYGDLQRCIFPTDAEYRRFRQVVVNVVMATDIFDKELGELRKTRWAKAFVDNGRSSNICEMSEEDRDEDDENRKATIVIEHIMQASDVAHTMQHWHVYQKWNRRLFDEFYTAYKAGRMEKDPASFWYAGELAFFDGYIIPLARKLKECGVFGVASDECLNYAMDNRTEWQAKGVKIVEELVASYHMREAEEAAAQANASNSSISSAVMQNNASSPVDHRGSGHGHRRTRFARRRSLMTSGG